MSHPSYTNTSIQNLLSNEEIVRATIEQIMKDFGMFGIEIVFTGNHEQAYEELMKQLTGPIEHLLASNPKRLWSVLYQVDISNIALEKTAALKPDFSPAQVIAHQVIERDLKKVLTRIYYRTNSTNM